MTTMNMITAVSDAFSIRFFIYDYDEAIELAVWLHNVAGFTAATIEEQVKAEEHPRLREEAETANALVATFKVWKRNKGITIN